LASCRTETRSDAAVASKAVVEAGPALNGPERLAAYNEAYRRGISLMETYLLLPRGNVASNPQAQTDLRAAIKALDVAIALDPGSSSAWWSRGKAAQLLGDHEHAYESFHGSYKIDEGKNPDSGVQLVLECLETGRGGEAVHVAEIIVQSQPENAGMLANLALAYLINGQIDEAVRTVSTARALDPEDEAIASAKRRIDDVKSGRFPKPHHIAEIAR
jgi:tetratricopeptide (TPR) repeat protein